MTVVTDGADDVCKIMSFNEGVSSLAIANIAALL